MRTLVLPMTSLWWREIIRFLRQRSRVIGSLAQPLVFWLILGAGLGHTFRPGDAAAGSGVGFLEYAFPGTVVMILLFTAIFSTITVIEDRREGFLQAVLVAPIPRAAIVLSKVLGGTTLAVGQAILFLALAPALGFPLTVASVLGMLLVMVVLGFALTALGFVIAWRMDSTAGFHAIMNLLLLPMWILSGAVFPADGAFPALRWLMNVNPVTYGLAALRRFLYAGSPVPGGAIPDLGTSLVVTAGFAAVVFVLAVVVARRRAVVGGA